MTRRSLFTKQFWREYRRDVLRSGRDGRARKGVFFRSALLVYAVGVLCWYGSALYRLHDAATYGLLGIMLLVVLVAAAGRKIALKLDDRKSLAEDLATTPPGVAQGLQDLAYGALALAERAVGELWLSRHTIPEGYEPASRRIQIEALRKIGTWNTMPTEARLWMMQPDGAWPLETVANVLAGAEALHTLLWVLYLVPELRPLEGLAAPISLKTTAAALQQPARGVRPTWDLRVARNGAQEFFLRCLAEGVHRGVVSAPEEDQRVALGDWAAGFHDGAAPDTFIGDQTVSESDAETLDMVHRSAACRILVLEGALALMDGRDHVAELATLIYRPLLKREATEPQA